MMTSSNEGVTSTFAELQISGYDSVAEIGRGGFAVVYRARRVAFAQDVAIKVLNGSAVDDNSTARFERERQVLGALAQHPNIVTVYDSGTTSAGAPFLVMEYLPGGPLSEHVKRQGPLDVRRVADIAVKLCGALETAHRTGILHRDIKPDNILISRYGEPVLADFGIARMRGALQTQSGLVTATLSHAPPEVLDGVAPTARSDVYSLASTLFALLAGSAPFVRETDVSIAPLLARVIRDPVPDLRPRGVPADVCALIEQAMAKDPGERPRSALEFGQAFQHLQRMNGAPASPLVVEQLPSDVAAVASGTFGPPDRQTLGHGAVETRAVSPHGTGPLGPRGTGPVGPPPHRAGPTVLRAGNTGAAPAGGPFGPPPGWNQNQPPPARRRRWLWPAVGAAAAAAVVAAAVIIPNLGGAEDPADPQVSAGRTTQLTPTDADTTSEVGAPTSAAAPAPGGPAAPPVDDLKPLLLQFTDFATGGGELQSPPYGELASVLWCNRTVPQDGKIAEAERGIAPPYEEGYQVYNYVASFTPGSAETFMGKLAETAATCADSANLDEPKPFTPPPGGEQAVRVTADKRDSIWVRYGNYVVKVELAFSTGNDVDDTSAPDVAAKAVAKVMQGAS